MRWRENHIIVPRRREVRDAVDHYFAVGDQLELARFEWESCYLERDPAALDRCEDEVLEPIRGEYEEAARVLIDALTLGGPPPLRWSWQRWNRRRAWLTWYLQEGRRARRHRNGAATPWGQQPVADDEPPF